MELLDQWEDTRNWSNLQEKAPGFLPLLEWIRGLGESEGEGTGVDELERTKTISALIFPSPHAPTLAR